MIFEFCPLLAKRLRNLRRWRLPGVSRNALCTRLCQRRTMQDLSGDAFQLPNSQNQRMATLLYVTRAKAVKSNAGPLHCTPTPFKPVSRQG